MTTDKNYGVIAWFAKNPVAANLLMLVILIGGLLTAFTINKEIFPNIELNLIKITVSYPGAAPQEIEEGINIKIEEALKNIQGVDKITSLAANGLATVTLEVKNGYDLLTVLDEAKLEIDAISTFPNNIETPKIYRVKPKSKVLHIAIYGSDDLIQLKELSKQIRDEINRLPAVSQAKLMGMRDYEISIELSEAKLREYQLTFKQVANAIQRSSLDLPSGAIQAYDGDMLLRTKAQAYTKNDFANIPIRTLADGSRVLLNQIAHIKDGFEEQLQYTRFNGQTAAIIKVSNPDNNNALAISEQIKNYIENRQQSLPANITITSWGDMTFYLKGRLNMMLSNMLYGAILVFFILALFLELRLAFWVMMGLPVCFLGALLFMPLPPFGFAINLLTLFAFILVLGIVVDDAIIIGESTYTEIEKNGQSLDNVISGVQKVALPATFGILTTIAAFTPMLMVSDTSGVIWQSIGTVVILCLIFSLIESKLILPAHLASMKPHAPDNTPQFILSRWKSAFNQKVHRFIHHNYRDFLSVAIKQRYNVLACFLGVLIVALAMVKSGIIRWVFFPHVPTDTISVQLEMVQGGPETDTLKTLQELESHLYLLDKNLQQQYGESFVKYSFTSLDSETKASMLVELTKGEDRELDSVTIGNLWQASLPQQIGIKSLTMDASTFNQEGDIEFRLESNNLDTLKNAAQSIKNQLANYQGVYDITDNLSSGSLEIQLKIRPEAQSLGITLSDLAQQVRHGFWGFEAQRLLRNQEELKVMVRYPLNQRRTIGHLEQMMIRTADGKEIPFNQVAETQLSESYASINRINGLRAINITAKVNKEIAEPRKILKDFERENLPQILSQYKDLTYQLDGSSKSENQSLMSLLKGFVLSIFVIYALMAIPLKSYTQPLIIMSIIPFGIIGALIGHLLLGLSVNILSLCGIVALAGVVINDSLILVDFINRGINKGLIASQAVIQASCNRFRAILLTSLTTFVGLIPIILEKSLQAKVVIPMATSLAFGILFSTLVTLILVPALYIIWQDICHHVKKLIIWYWYGHRHDAN